MEQEEIDMAVTALATMRYYRSIPDANLLEFVRRCESVQRRYFAEVPNLRGFV